MSHGPMKVDDYTKEALSKLFADGIVNLYKQQPVSTQPYRDAAANVIDIAKKGDNATHREKVKEYVYEELLDLIFKEIAPRYKDITDRNRYTLICQFDGLYGIKLPWC